MLASELDDMVLFKTPPSYPTGRAAGASGDPANARPVVLTRPSRAAKKLRGLPRHGYRVLAIYHDAGKYCVGSANASEAMKPYFESAVNHTMSILHNVDESTIGAHDMVVSAQTITDSAVPAMQLALNQTAAMITRLEKLAANPVMQISLTGASGGAVGAAG